MPAEPAEPPASEPVVTVAVATEPLPVVDVASVFFFLHAGETASAETNMRANEVRMGRQ